MIPQAELLLSIKELQEACEYWKPMLGLSDWRIHIKLTAKIDLGSSVARSTWALPRRIGYIRVIDPESDGASDTHASEDFEILLVHEMLHLAFSAAHEVLDTALGDDSDALQMEQQIDHLAYHFSQLRRRSSKKKDRLSFDCRLDKMWR